MAKTINAPITENYYVKAEIQDTLDRLEDRIDNLRPEDFIKDGDITSTMLADDAVDSSKIEDGAITSDKIAENSIEGDKLQDGSITEEKLAGGSVTADAIADNSVTTDKIQPGAVDWNALSENVHDKFLYDDELNSKSDNAVQNQALWYKFLELENKLKNKATYQDVIDAVTKWVTLHVSATVGPLKTLNGEELWGKGDIEIPVITVDDHLDSESTNPVENRAITSELDKKADKDAMQEALDKKADLDYVQEELDNKQEKGDYVSKEWFVEVTDDLQIQIGDRACIIWCYETFLTKFEFEKQLARLDGLIDEVKEEIIKETDRAETAEKELDDKITEEKERAEQAEKDLDSKIEAETLRAKDAEKDLTEKIEAETARAKEAEKNLDDKIAQEKSRAETKEQELDDKIAAEQQRAETAEKDLGDKIKEEQTRAETAEKALETKITEETERATAKENELDEKITTEKNRAEAAEQKLQEGVTLAQKPIAVTFEAADNPIDEAGDVSGTFTINPGQDGDSRNIKTQLKVKDDSHRHSNETITSLDSNKLFNTIPQELLPPSAFASFVVVKDQDEAMTNPDIVKNTIVKVEGEDDVLYYCVDPDAETFDDKFDPFRAGYASSVPWSGVTDKPETATRWPKFEEVTNKPTTLAGYGITDGVNAVVKNGDGTFVTGGSVSGHTLALTTGKTPVTDSAATLDWGKKVTVATVDGTNITVGLPANPNTDTHYTAKLYAGKGTAAANEATTNGNTKLTLADNNAVTSSVLITGTDNIDISSSATGVVTVKGPTKLANPNALTVGGKTYDGSTAVTITKEDLGATSNTGTVTSVAMTVPDSLTISGSPITTAGTLALGVKSGYEIPTTAKLNNFVTIDTEQTITGKKHFSETAEFNAQPGLKLNHKNG